MAVYTIKTVQTIPATIDTVWDFFSSPDNLRTITPAHLCFTVISKEQSPKAYPGQIIEYRIKPILGIPLYWMTEITQVVDKEYFIDEQRFGPYAFWHHQHHFRQVDKGVEMTDLVHYKLPLWLLGDIANTVFVREQLRGIFNYRYQKTAELFGIVSSQKKEILFL
jgi:ligand-binding SRPBCC domain-containing protein